MNLRAVTAALLIAMFTATPLLATATIVIENKDGPGEGFNDPSPFTAVGGNNATTIGQARLNAFQYAADLWATCLHSPVEIRVAANMDPLYCNMSHAVLGSASATTVHRNFAGVQPGVWYPQALANSLAGLDLSYANPDIEARFNSNLDSGDDCLSGIGWYYGYDQNSGGDIDFVTVVFHEIGHGLGFQSFMNAGGEFFLGFPDTYASNLYHAGIQPPHYPDMTDSQRATCNIDAPNLVWSGTYVTNAASGLLLEGISSGRARIYAPNPYERGSSISHFSKSATPNQFMEPAYTGPNHTYGLAVNLLKDVGWKAGAPVHVVLSESATSAITFPRLRTQIALADIGSSDAYNVRAALAGGPAWLEITDGVCEYGDIAAGTSSNGAADGYELDLSAWPGGAFTVNLNVTWEDDCGLTGEAVLKKSFDDVLTGLEPLVKVRNELLQNAPNPFNPTTMINFSLESSRQVELAVFDVSGRRIRTLLDGVQPTGASAVEWNGRDDSGNPVASGVYFYRIRAGSFEATKRMVMLK